MPSGSGPDIARSDAVRRRDSRGFRRLRVGSHFWVDPSPSPGWPPASPRPEIFLSLNIPIPVCLRLFLFSFLFTVTFFLSPLLTGLLSFFSFSPIFVYGHHGRRILRPSWREYLAGSSARVPGSEAHECRRRHPHSMADPAHLRHGCVRLHRWPALRL